MDKSENLNSVIYTEGIGDIGVPIVFQDDTVWVTQENMSKLFDVDDSGISKHLKNIFEIGELQREATVAKIAIVQMEGGRKVNRNLEHYNLDAIISVGYRVNSQKATQFRIWATGIIKQYIKDGYVINEALLRQDPEKLNKLAAKIRELRASEKNVYASVRECFKLAASDYEPSSNEVKRFYSLLQDKFHHAVTGMTASKLILDRANHTNDKMGVVHTKASIPTLQESKTGKNYLEGNELYRLHLLSEQFLLYAESTALRGENMTMRQLHDQLDNLLKLNGYPVFGGYEDYLKDKADAHAEREYKSYIEIKKLEHIGVKVDLESFYIGLYDEYKEQTNKISIKELNESIERKSLEALTPQVDTKFNESLKIALNYNPKN
ncbi:MAG: virulence RhuM family protein [Proteobacteria bacterium]|nr:virulence RhuM family protein [Pseudomonadota bacterium]